MIVYFLLGLVVLLCILHNVFKYDKDVSLIRKLPGLKENFLIGNALILPAGSAVGLFNLGREYAKKFNGIYGWWAFYLKAVNLYNPEDIEIITSTMKHSDKSPVYGIIKPWLQEGLLVSGGAKWQSRRKILTPAFHFNILKQFWPILEENSQRLVETLEKSQGTSVNITTVISEYTLSSICETAMGTRLHEETTSVSKSYKDAIYKLGKLMVDRFTRIYLAPVLIFNLSSTGRNTYKNLKIVQSFTKTVIEDRKEYIEKHGIKVNEESISKNEDVYMSSKKKKIAMLDLLISAEQDGVIDRQGIQEEVDTFMFEGHDTTAAGLTYCLMALANHKHIQDKIVAELKEVFGDSSRTPTMDDLTRMRYLDCCIKESMRLYPPVPFISRELSENTQLSNYTVPAGTHVHIHIYDLHRREDLFKNATVFDPDRFLPENSAGRHLYSYIPFSAGPRNCIGQKFAMMEMKSCLVAVLRKFELLPVTVPEELVFMADIVLRNTKPVYAKFVERNTNTNH